MVSEGFDASGNPYPSGFDAQGKPIAGTQIPSTIASRALADPTYNPSDQVLQNLRVTLGFTNQAEFDAFMASERGAFAKNQWTSHQGALVKYFSEKLLTGQATVNPGDLDKLVQLGLIKRKQGAAQGSNNPTDYEVSPLGSNIVRRISADQAALRALRIQKLNELNNELSKYGVVHLAANEPPEGEEGNAIIDNAIKDRQDDLDAIAAINKFGDLGSALGAVLASRLGGNAAVNQFVISPLISTIFDNAAEMIANGGLIQTLPSGLPRNVLSDFGSELFAEVKGAGIGALSAFLVGELVNALGLKGFVAEGVQTIGNTVVSQVIGNIVKNIGGTKVGIFEGVGSSVSIASAAASFLGSKLADQIIKFDTVGGQIGSQVGAAFGAWNAGAYLAAFGVNPVTIIGAIIAVAFWKIVGGLIGSLFGGTPVSGADASWDYGTQEFGVANAYSKHGGNREAAIGMASTVSAFLNDIIGASNGRLENPGAVQTGNYGMRKSEFVYRPFSSRSTTSITQRWKGKDAFQNAVKYGIFTALKDIDFRLLGGDIFTKRAIYNTIDGIQGYQDLNTETFIGDVKIASDFGNYFINRFDVNYLVSNSRNSVFSAGWIIELARANEIGLNRRARSDWFGGFEQLISLELGINVSRVELNLESTIGDERNYVVFDAEGLYQDYLSDTIIASDITHIVSGVGFDTIDLRTGTLANQIGYTVNGKLNNDIAVTGTDFTGATATTVSFATTALRASVSVTLANDGLAEAAEKFLGQLANGTGVSIIGGAAEATILDGNAALPTLLVGRSYALEGDGFAVFRVALSEAATGAVSAALATAAVNATAGTDYGAGIEVSDDGLTGWTAATALTFATGQTQKFVRVAVMTDNGVGGDGKPTNVEGNERFTLTATVTAGAALLANAPDAVSGAVTASGTGTIVDASVGTAPLAWIDSVTVDEASGQAVFSIARSRAGAAGSVQFSTADRVALTIDVAATVDAGDGDDTVYASNLGDNVFGGAGNDTLYGGRLDDWLLGGDGNDTLNAGSLGAGTLGGDGNYLNGGAGDDLLIGREGSDWLEGGDGTDTLEGGDGGDILAGGGGVGDVMHGGRGDDQYIFRLGDQADTVRDESGITLSDIVGQAYDLSPTNPLLAARMADANSGVLFRSGAGLNNWRGGGIQAETGGVAAGGEDALVFGVGIGLEDIAITKSADGKDLIITLVPDGVPSGDVVTLKDWFSAFNKIEILRFADGNEVRIADFDTFTLGSNDSEVIVGTGGNDFVNAGGGDDLVYLLSGNDFGNGGLGNDSVSGDSGNDIVMGADGDDRVHGGAGRDAVSGGRGNDYVTGDEGDDILAGGEGTDEVVGGSGNDVFKFQRGDGVDTLIDQLSNEWVTVWRSGQATVIDANNSAISYLVDNDGSLLQRQSGQADIKIYDALTNTWSLRTRYDIETGTLMVHKPAGANIVSDTDTVDTDTLEFGIGIDINDIQFQTSVDGRDLIIGIEQSGGFAGSLAGLTDRIVLKEWVSNANATGSVEKFVFFNTGSVDTSNTATGYALKGGTDGNDSGAAVTGAAGRKNWVTGGAGDDTVTGAELDDILNGNSGQDTLIGGAGNDVLLGGVGNDTLIGGAGADKHIGGDGLDTAAYDNAVTVYLGGDGTNTGDAVGDTFDSVEGLRGSSGADNLYGDYGENDLRGGAGNDRLEGRGGDDFYTFTRGDGADTINDVASGGEIVVVDDNGVLQPPYVATVQLVDREGSNYQFEQIITNSETGEIVFRREYNNPVSQGTFGFVRPTDFDDAGWEAGYVPAAGTLPKVTIPVSAPGGSDTLFFEDATAAGAAPTADMTVGLSDLRFAFIGNNLEITLLEKVNGTQITGGSVVIENFRSGASVSANNAIEFIQFADGSSIQLSALKFDSAGNFLTTSTDTAAAPVDAFLVTNAGATLTGGFGNDVLYAGMPVTATGASAVGTTFNNTLNGGAGDDLLIGGLGSDVLNGGTGTDTVSYLGSDRTGTASVGVTVNLSTGTGSGTGTEAAGDTYTSIENVIGSQFNDTITGNAVDNVLKGNRGADTIVGGTGTVDTTTYAEGADVLIGDDGNDTLTGGVGEDNLDGGADNDLLTGGGDRDVLSGGEGNDILIGDNTAGTAVGGNLVANAGFEDAGDAANDVTTGYGLTTTDLPGWTSSSANPVQLVTSASGVTGLTGTRAIHLDNGAANTVSQSIANLTAGETLTFGFSHALRQAAATGGVEVWWNGLLVQTYTATGTAMTAISGVTLTAIEGTNKLEFKSIGAVDGAGSVIDNITLTRTTGAADQLIGGAGQDRLLGGAGNDVLLGGDGDDIATANITAGVSNTAGVAGLYGGTGDDTLDGGAGNDTLNGEAGNDKYLFRAGSGNDQVTVGGGQDDLIYDGIASTQLWLQRVDATTGAASDTGADLLITAIGQGSAVTVKGWFTATANRARRIVAADKILAVSDIEQLRLAMRAVSTTVPAAWPTGTSTQVTALNSAMATVWQDSANYTDRVVITGTTGNDTMVVDPVLIGGAIFDPLSGTDAVNGGANDDQFLIGAYTGNKTIAGNGGFDTVTATVDNATLYLVSNGLLNVEKVTGNGKANFNIYVASGGTLNLSAVAVDGVTAIIGAAGNETITGSTANDTLIGAAGNDTLNGGDGNDTIRGGVGTNTLDGGSGTDTLDLFDLTTALTVSLNATGGGTFTTGSASTLTTNTFTNFENIIGGTNADTITGNAGNNVLDGGNFNGIDTLIGGDGDDILIGRGGSDILRGGNGIDTASYVTMSAASSTVTNETIAGTAFTFNGVVIDLVANTASGSEPSPVAPTTANRAKQGDAAGDWFHSIENITGSQYSDRITGNTGDNLLAGGAANDALFGAAGNDTLQGDAGSDYLDGGTGTNTAVFAGKYSEYAISTTGPNVTVTGIGARAGDGTDTLVNIQVLKFADFTISLGVSTNNAPMLGEPQMADQAAVDGAAFSYQIPATSFIDFDIGTGTDVMVLTATLADGSPLPSWLTFNAATRTFSGTVPAATASNAGEVGKTYEIKVTATDSGASVSDNFLLSISQAGGAAIIGTTGNDALNGTFRGETITGNGGDDTLNASLGADVMDGGTGTDTADYAGSTFGVSVNLATGAGSGGFADGDTFVSIEKVVGSAFDDTITGSIGQDDLRGGAGDDTIDGGKESDLIVGGAGADILRGGDGVDTIYARFNASGQLEDVVDGGQGLDELRLGETALGAGDGSTNGGTLDLASASGNPTAIENVVGSDHADVISGNEFSNILKGGLGNDTLYGGSGKDTLEGGAGDDKLAGGIGADIIDGGSGSDTASYYRSTLTGAVETAGITVDLAAPASNTGIAAGDSFIGIENLEGTAGGDTLLGDAAANRLSGMEGNDTLRGQDGNDTLEGGDGDDTLWGGAGNDVLSGGAGIDSAHFSAARSQYTIDFVNRTVTHLGTDGQDTYSNVEFLRFGDGVVVDLSNQVPTYAGTLTAQNFNDNAAGSYVIPTSAFNDPDGNQVDPYKGLSFTATLSSGAALPSWLTFNATTKTFSYAAGAAAIGASATVRVTASDGLASTFGDFTVAIAQGPGAPITGTTANNLLTPTFRAETIDGLAGVDTVTYAASNAGVSVNLATGAASGGHAQGDTVLNVENVTGSAFADILTGTTGDNVLEGNAGADNLAGGGGNDTLRGGSGADTLDGGTGTDTLSYLLTDNGALATTGVNVNLAASTASGGDATGDVIAPGSFENLEGTNQADDLRGDGNANVITGQGGNDTIYGGSGNDTLSGGDGDDQLYGEAGLDNISGGLGNDIIHLTTLGEDTIDGGTGSDTVSFAGTGTGQTIDLATAGWTGIENVTGTSGIDALTGDASANVLDGGSGDDAISGGAGADTLIGGLGNDRLSYSQSAAGAAFNTATAIGSSVVNGVTIATAVVRSLNGVNVNIASTNRTLNGATFVANSASGADAQGDTISGFESLKGSESADQLAGSDGGTTVLGLGGNDVIYGGSGNDTLYGGAGDDFIFGLAGTDTIYGDDGNDRLFGEGQSDSLFGGAGNDLLDAGDSGDFLDGGTGNDILIGGLGADRYTIRRDSGADAVYNYDDDNAVDTVVYDNSAGTIAKTDLWFTKSGKDLLVKILGTTTVTTIKDWFTTTTPGDWTAADNFFVDMFVSGANQVQQVALPTLLGYMTGAEPASFSALSSTLQSQISTAWGLNNPPVINSNGGGDTAAISIAENTAAVTTVAATDPNGSTISYAVVGGADMARFAVNSTTGVLTFIAAPDFDAPTDSDGNNVYQVIVSASDGGLTDTQIINVTVTNVNEAPVITSGGSITVAENTTAVTTVTSTDPEGTARSYSILGGVDAARFTINATTGVLAFVSAPNFESPADTGTNNVYDLVVRVSDGVNNVDQAIAVTVSNVNEAPSITSSATFNMAENQTTAGTVTSTDPELNVRFYSLVGGADQARFTINSNSGVLSFLSAPNFEAPSDSDTNNSYLVTVRVSDGSLWVDQAVTVNVGNGNDAPVITSNGGGATAAISVTENSTAVTTVTASDEDAGATRTFSLAGGADAGLFTINSSSGLLTFNSGPNFESPADAGGNNVYDVVVRVSDGTAFDDQAIAITVTNGNDAPVIFTNGGGATASVNVAENNTAVTTVGATDQDAGATLTYQLVGGADMNRFSINSSTGALVFNTAPNFEAPGDVGGNNVYDVIVRVTDGTLFDDQAIAVTVTPVNETPGAPFDSDPVAGSGGSISEGYYGTATAVGITVSAVDPDGTTPTYGLGSNPNNWFTINPTTGVISIVAGATIDFENVNVVNGLVSINVTASDGVNSVQSNTLNIAVSDVNEAPVITSPASGNISETAGAGSQVGVAVTTTDPDKDTSAWGKPSHRFQIIGGTGASYFAINQLTGVITTTAASVGAALNYDAGVRSYSLTIRVTDNGFSGIAVDQNYTVNVTPVNEEPGTPWGFSASLAENSGAGAYITTVGGSSDPEGEGVEYELVTNPDGLFSLSAAGVLTLNSSLNFEARPGALASTQTTIQFRARSYDAAAGTWRYSAAQSGTFTLTNVNEAPDTPVNVADGVWSFTENSGAVRIATLSRSDVDGTTPNLVLVGGDAGYFQIVNGNEIWTVANLDYEAIGRSSLTASVVASDGSLSSGAWSKTVSFGNLNDTGFGLSVPGSITVSENLPFNTAVTSAGAINAVDPDGFGMTYSIAGGNINNAFVIDPSTGVLRVSGSGVDYEAANWLEDANGKYAILTIAASDGAQSATADLRVNIGNVRKYVYNNGALDLTKYVMQTQYTNLSGEFGGGGMGWGYNWYNEVWIREIATGNVVLYLGQESQWEGAFTSPFPHSGNPTEGYTGFGTWPGPYTLYSDDEFNENSFYGVPYGNPFLPVVLDLGGDGFDLLEPNESGLVVNLFGDDRRQLTGWVKPTDGILTLDRDGDGLVANLNEITFVKDKEGATTDLEGLLAFDTNGNWMLDAGDAAFAAFRVWVDRNQDGFGQADELVSLAEAGIVSISLVRELTNASFTGSRNLISATAAFMRADGTAGRVADVGLGWLPVANGSSAQQAGGPLFRINPATGAFEEVDPATGQVVTDKTLAVSTTAEGEALATPPAQQLPTGARLALDADGNGAIDIATETYTLEAALGRFDSDGDARITAADGEYVNLRLWTDANRNGRAEVIELSPLAALGLTSLGLSAGGEGPGNGQGEGGPEQPPAIEFARQSLGEKSKKYYLQSAGGALFVRYRKENAIIDPRAGGIAGATIISFKDKAIGLLSPIVLDLDGNGVSLKSRKKSDARFDMDGDGKADDTGWVGKKDGLLVIDRNGDGAITMGSEISFLTDSPDAKSDLQALRAFDSNGDSKLDASDARFGEFKVWVDANENGTSEAGELRTLAELNITEIGLAGRAADQTVRAGDNIVLATSTFKRADGSVGTVGDVALAFDPSSAKGVRTLPATNGGGDGKGDGEPGPITPDTVLLDASAQLGSRDDQLAAMRSALGSATFGAPDAGQQTMELAPERVAAGPADATLAQMIQSMATFGATSGASDLLKRQIAIDSGLDWLAASAA